MQTLVSLRDDSVGFLLLTRGSLWHAITITLLLILYMTQQAF